MHIRWVKACNLHSKRSKEQQDLVWDRGVFALMHREESCMRHRRRGGFHETCFLDSR
jgi:hypothetical protein